MNQSKISIGTHDGFETSRKFYCKFLVKIRENRGFDRMGFDPLRAPDERGLVWPGNDVIVAVSVDTESTFGLNVRPYLS